MRRSGICLIWSRSPYFSLFLPYREEDRYLKAANGQLHASESDRTGRNPGMTRLVRRSGAVSGGTCTAFFSLVQTLRQRKRKCSGSPIRTIPKKRCWLLQGIDISVDSTGMNVTYTNRAGLLGVQGWRNGESTRLPPVWPRCDSQTQRHM